MSYKMISYLSVDSATNTSLPFRLIGKYGSTGQPINEYSWLNRIPVGLSVRLHINLPLGRSLLRAI